MRIAIDLGHGVGQDRGAVGLVAEETIINNVGALVINKLRALGNEVLTVRPTNAISVSDSLNKRVVASNNFNPEIYISIHANAGGGQGTEVFTYNGKELSYARNILNNLVALGFRNRGIKSESLYVINHTKAESLLLEICFVDTQSDVDLYHSLGDEKIADAIVKGIVGQIVTISPTINTRPIAQEVKSPIQIAKEFVGSRCLELQKLLIAKGYDCGGYGADGSFGQGTYNSLIQFQKDNPPLISDGLAGALTFAKLKEVVTQSNDYNWIVKLQSECNAQGLSNQKVDGYSGQNTLSGCPTLKIGSQGNITKLLQEKLNSLGYSLVVDGNFGSKTSRAVKQYQLDNSLSSDSIVGRNTWRKLLGLS